MALYDDFAETFSKSRKSLRWAELDAILDDILTQQYTSILDIGCGNGRLLEFLHQRTTSLSYLWVDHSPAMIAEARKLHPEANFLVSDMNTLSLPISFDAIVLLASFHHLASESERIHTLHTLKTLLQPHGRIYMTNWNLREQERYQPYRNEHNDFMIKIGEFSRYYHGFSLRELEALFREGGFSPCEHRIFEGGRNIFSILEHAKTTHQ